MSKASGGVVEKEQSGGSSDMPPYLSSLSKAQYNAVTADPNIPLQILAGPGSGKTRVLVARVAWLILAQKIRPSDLVVVTFTNKASNEMKQRLIKLIGPERTLQLILGTFHATCARYLRKNAKAVGLQNNFSICDADESKKTIKAILKEKKAMLESMNLPGNLKVEQIMSEISRAKAKNLSPKDFMIHIKQISKAGSSNSSGGGRRGESTEVRRTAAEIYFDYQDHLKKNNSVDFDDLLVYGVRLFRDESSVIGNVQHVLVDEFQDTNSIQYSLMAELAGPNGSRHSVSVVGDPDQSIYGWRSAEVGNLALMKQDFGGKRVKDGKASEGIKQVFLEENYRSTGHILKAAKGIIEGDSDRIDRGLYTSHPVGHKVVLKRHASSQHEASFVATEVKRLVAHSGGLLNYDDFAILLRYNALSREVERQLQAENIPSRMLGGARFFERKEVKDILAYLTLADNPLFTPALERVINVPKRAIGDKALSDLKELAHSKGVRTMEIVEEAAEASKPIMGIKPGVQKSLKSFFEVIKEIRKQALSHTPVAIIIETLIKRIDYEGLLKKEDDYAQRWENVKELINFSTIVAQAGGAVLFESTRNVDSDEEADEDGMDFEAEGGDVSWGSFATVANEDSDNESEGKSQKSNSKLSTTVKSESETSKRSHTKRKTVETIDLISSEEEEKEEEEEDVKPFIKRVRSNQKAELGSNKRKKRGVNVKAEEEMVTKAINAKIVEVSQDENDSDTSATLVETVAEEEEVKSPLRVFLEASTLSTDMEQDDQDGKSPKLTIATTHAAKGLEFPVVFVLAVEGGVFPFFRCTSPEEINEECRLLYVAATRAQTNLYLNYCSSRMSYGETRDQQLSPFIARIADAKMFKGGSWRSSSDANAIAAGGFMGPGANMSSNSTARTKKHEKVDFANNRPNVTKDDREVIAKVLDRPPVDEKFAADLISKFENSDAGARCEAATSANTMRDEVRNSSLFNPPRRFESGPVNFTTARSLVMPSTTSIGSSIGVKTLDKDGWTIAGSSRTGGGKTQNKDGPSTGTFTKAGAAPFARTAGGIKSSIPGYTSSSFMDEYRQSKNHLAHEGMTMNGLLGGPTKADLNSFQSKHAESLKGFMDMLPANSSTNGSGTSTWKQAATTTSTSSTSSTSSSNNNISSSRGGKQFTLPIQNKVNSKAGDGSSSDTNSTIPRKRLGSGRPRKK